VGSSQPQAFTTDARGTLACRRGVCQVADPSMHKPTAQNLCRGYSGCALAWDGVGADGVRRTTTDLGL